jgi:hypothetical protein
VGLNHDTKLVVRATRVMGHRCRRTNQTEMKNTAGRPQNVELLSLLCCNFAEFIWFHRGHMKIGFYVITLVVVVKLRVRLLWVWNMGISLSVMIMTTKKKKK